MAASFRWAGELNNRAYTGQTHVELGPVAGGIDLNTSDGAAELLRGDAGAPQSPLCYDGRFAPSGFQI